jgi:Na+-translocating ferredoxin:NAD+ oxidoreductase RnfC subunit
MMGREIEPATFGIGQQTGQITALPAGNVVVERYRHPLQHVRTIAGTACTQCKDCTELCPRYLLGYDVTPHLSMRRFFSWGDEPSEEWFGNAAGCTGCGLCELYACPMAISPRRVQDHLKTVLTGCERKEGGGDIHPDRSGRLVPAARLKRRTDIVNYDVEASLRELPAPGRAITSLTQPYGRVLEVLVKEGDKVEVGQPLARPAAGDETSVPVYAGVPGRVSETSSSVVIDRGGAA